MYGVQGLLLKQPFSWLIGWKRGLATRKVIQLDFVNNFVAPFDLLNCESHSCCLSILAGTCSDVVSQFK